MGDRRRDQKEKTIMHLSDKLGGKLQGTIAIGFRKLRSIPIIEIRNAINNRSINPSQDLSLQFYISKMGRTLYKNDFRLHRYERVKSIAQDYYIYELGYSLEPSYKIKSILEEYDYGILYESEDLIGEFESMSYAFKRTNPDFLRKKQIEELVKYCKDIEVGKI